jgi:hypothetical protein
VTPDRWPVFLRTEGDHGGDMSELLHNPGEVRAAVETAMSKGWPLANMMLVEFASDPIAPGLYRKHSVMRLGEAYTPFWNASHTHWNVQGPGTPQSDEQLEEEWRQIRDNTFVEALKPAFELSGVEYGRADFGLVNGKPQVWEINLNPDMKRFGLDHASAVRRGTVALVEQRFFEALTAIDTPGSG